MDVRSTLRVRKPSLSRIIYLVEEVQKSLRRVVEDVFEWLHCVLWVSDMGRNARNSPGEHIIDISIFMAASFNLLLEYLKLWRRVTRSMTMNFMKPSIVSETPITSSFSWWRLLCYSESSQWRLSSHKELMSPLSQRDWYWREKIWHCVKYMHWCCDGSRTLCESSRQNDFHVLFDNAQTYTDLIKGWRTIDMMNGVVLRLGLKDIALVGKYCWVK